MFALLTSSASLCAREPRPSEGETATELFGQIATQSGCETYAVGWFDRVKQQVEARCAATLASARELASSLPSPTRFVVEVAVARPEYERRFGVKLPRAANVLAHLLTAGSASSNTPLLLYQQANTEAEPVSRAPALLPSLPIISPTFVFDR